jgi:hypothetical protein
MIVVDRIAKAIDNIQLKDTAKGECSALFVEKMTRQEIEKQMDELARKYVETHDRAIIEELNRSSRQLQELEKHFRR